MEVDKLLQILIIFICLFYVFLGIILGDVILIYGAALGIVLIIRNLID